MISILYIVTAVHNRYDITNRFIKQLEIQTYTDYVLVLVDDGSTDGTDVLVKRELPNSIILYGNGNLWWGGSLHKAYKYLKKIVNDKDMILICNDDISFDSDFLEIGISYLQNNKKNLISSKGIDSKTGEVLEFAEYRNPITAEGIRMESGQEGNCSTTRALFIMGDVYKKIKGMHPVLLPHYCSDIEYTLRAARKGFKNKSFDDLQVEIHQESTGIVKPKGLKQRFSKSYMNNPIYKFNFVIMTTQLVHLPKYFMHYFRRKKK